MPTPDPTWYLDIPDPSDLMEGDPPAPGDRWCSLWGPRKPGGPSLPCSPSIEGTADEWLAIAEAIEQRKRRAFARAAFAPGPDADHGRLWSPRNAASDATDAILTSYELAELVADIRAKLAPAPPASPPAVSDDRCEDLAPPGYAGHWRDWHRGHGCKLDPDRKLPGATVRTPTPAPGTRPPGVPMADPAAPAHPMAEG